MKTALFFSHEFLTLFWVFSIKLKNRWLDYCGVYLYFVREKVGISRVSVHQIDRDVWGVELKFEGKSHARVFLCAHTVFGCRRVRGH